MTQHELIIEYINEHGYIIPAQLGGKSYLGYTFGSETSKRCREIEKPVEQRPENLRKYPKLERRPWKKFKVYYFPGKVPSQLKFPDEWSDEEKIAYSSG